MYEIILLIFLCNETSKFIYFIPLMIRRQAIIGSKIDSGFVAYMSKSASIS